ncbi:MAG: DNA polymerase III subunit gamma/tau [Bacteroidales bacterium]|nr:DNA polymerase III subunit gamma/tau [Bacteroidales bacterium]
MENYIVSARKYRPATFDMVVGQDVIVNTLKSAIKNKHLAHAYLFCGPRGVGKTTCARILAKTINCFNLKDNVEACNECESCVSFNTLRSFNIHELDAASNNKVEDIRSLNEQVRIPPQIGKYSIYIIDEVHMLSSAAFNAFLKTLEEPPAHAIFILATTEKHKIIPTILSRCQIFDFNRIRVEDIVARLMYVAKNESVEAEEEALHIIARKADGALRDALSIFDQTVSLGGRSITYRDVIENLNVLDYEYYFKTTGGAVRGDLSTVLLTFNEILSKGFDAHNFVTGLNSHFRDLLVSKDEATLKLLETTESVRQRYLRQTGECSADFLYKALEAGSYCDINYRNSKNPRLHVELFLIRLCGLTEKSNREAEKKKQPAKPHPVEEGDMPLPSKSEIIRQADTAEAAEKKISADHSHIAVVEKAPRTFSIRDVITDTKPPADSKPAEDDRDAADTDVSDTGIPAMELNEDNFALVWKEFREGLSNEGPRIISMLKSLKFTIEEDNIIRIYFSNASQKDIFNENYRQRMLKLLKSRFLGDETDIETAVDISETRETPYTDEQKYNYLKDKYPKMKDFIKTFNLDFI